MLVYQRVQHTSDKFCIPLRSSTTLSSMHSPLEPVRNKLVATQMANRPLQQVVPSLLLVSPLLLLVSNQSNNLSKNIHIPQIKSNLEASSDSDFPKSQSFSIHWFHGYSMDIPWIPMGKPWIPMGKPWEATEVPLHPSYLDDAYEGELLVLFVDLLGAPGRVSFCIEMYILYFSVKDIYIYSQFFY